METPKISFFTSISLCLIRSIVGENEINVELTEKAKKDPKYHAYRTWLTQKGVLWKDVKPRLSSKIFTFLLRLIFLSHLVLQV